MIMGFGKYSFHERIIPGAQIVLSLYMSFSRSNHLNWPIGITLVKIL